MKIGVLLSGCGVYDGAEIHESTFALLAIDEHGAEAVCMAPDIPQHHVLNHINGQELDETRNVLVESARIARGNIKNLKDVKASDIHALVLPGGFGAAKNLSDWAFKGADSELHPDVKRIILEVHNEGKPICALCISPAVIAKAFEGSGKSVHLTVGTTDHTSSNDIPGTMEALQATGAVPVMRSVKEIEVDEKNKIISAPCYMMDASITEIRNDIRLAIDKTIELASG